MVEELTDLSIEDFETKYLNAEKPVLIKDYAKAWPAMQWTYESLKQRAGHNQVFVRRNTSEECYKTGKKYNIESMKFCDYIENIQAGNKKAYSSYLAVQNMRNALPELQDDIEVPKYIKKLHGGPFLWFAMQGHYEFCHFDPDDNILMVLKGEKRVRLYPAVYLQNLYPNALGSRGRTIQSNVNADNNWKNDFPNFENVKCYECTVKAGDLLYFPAFWWHQVTSVQTTISINIFFGNDGENIYMTKIMNSNQFGSFKYWLLNIIEQNKDHEQFQNVLQHLPDSLKSFLMKQWHEIPTDIQLNQLIQIILHHLKLDCLPAKTKVSKHPPQLKIRGLLWR